MSEDNIEEILKQIEECWKETKDKFGKDFPFEDDLDIVIKGKIKDLIKDNVKQKQ